MRFVLAVAGVALAVGLASAQGLGDAARKEQERRQKNHEKGVAARAFSDTDLRAGGAASSTEETTSSSADVSEPHARREGDRPSTSSGSGPVDGARAAGRRRLDALYGQIASQANALVAEARGYTASGCDKGTGAECQTRAASLGRLACAVGQNLEAADDLGRQAWLQPGEVRELRDRHGLEDDLWYEISRLSNTYCRG